jgi:hypothetical protein
MGSIHKKIVLTVEQKLELNEEFEIGELATELAKKNLQTVEQKPELNGESEIGQLATELAKDCGVGIEWLHP